jgi:hypothetical protein
MTFKQIAGRMTGISCPFFGVSWNPSEPDILIAQRVLTFLEDRRVLFNPYELECPDHCVHSVIEIRQFLTSELGRLSSKDALSEHLRAMRAACRRFLDTIQADDRHRIIQPFSGGFATWQFCAALGELRAAVGLRVGILAVMYGLSVDGELEKILPPKPAASDA